MKPGIFYLYEYNKSQRLRNAGFLKVIHRYHSCILQLHAQNLPVAQSELLKLCAFYLKDGTANAAVLAEISCIGHTLSARLNSAETRFPDGRSLNQIDGFLLPLPNGNILAATSPETGIGSGGLHFVSPKEAERNEPAADSSPMSPASASKKSTAGSPLTAPIQEGPDTQNTDLTQPESAQQNTALTQQESSRQNTDSAQQESTRQNTDLTQQESAGHSAENEILSPLELSGAPQNSSSREPVPVQVEAESITSFAETFLESQKIEASEETVRKIRRSDLAGLPRRYWSLANNSFLLHGYHNYNHLLLVEEDGHYWLGVPGIYDARESRAAELFGFPQFTDSYNDRLSLSENERNDYGIFGYWCRYLK